MEENKVKRIKTTLDGLPFGAQIDRSLTGRELRRWKKVKRN